jgi:hypothetical protein
LEATRFRYGNLRQATTFELVLTCHGEVVLVQSRLWTRMAIPGEVLLRQRFCLGSECRAIFFLCSHCDRGQRYCSLACRRQARFRQRRRANHLSFFVKEIVTVKRLMPLRCALLLRRSRSWPQIQSSHNPHLLYGTRSSTRPGDRPDSGTDLPRLASC